MNSAFIKRIFNSNIAPALKLKKKDANIETEMSEETAEKHRKFAVLTKEEQTQWIAQGFI